MTHRSEKNYIKVVVNLSIVVDSTSPIDREARLALLFWILLQLLIPSFNSI
jgi:hypothetical protein